MEEENKEIKILIDPNAEVDLDDDCILPVVTNNEKTMDLEEVINTIKQEGDKSE